MEFFSQLIIRELNKQDKNREVLLGRRFLIGKNNNSTPSNTNTEVLLEVRILDCKFGVEESGIYIGLEINSNTYNHRQGTKEWHDMNWCAQWSVVCELTYN